MRTLKIEDIEIQEPPLQEIQKKRSCFKRACFSSCGCLVIFLIGLILLLKFVSSPQPKKLNALPDIVQASIPIYDKENIENIEKISGEKRGRAMNILFSIPNVVVKPIAQLLNLDTDVKNAKDDPILKEAYGVLQSSFVDHRDIVKIAWIDLTAEPEFIAAYYKVELEKKGFNVEFKVDSEEIKEIFFDGGDIDGTLFITDHPEKSGTEFISLTVRIPN